MSINLAGHNPHAPQPVTIKSLISSLIKNRQLIYQMAKREVAGRYKGSFLGLGWSFFNPIIMLAIYTFVFSEIFKMKWSVLGEGASKTQFATVLFIGIIILNLVSEVLIRSPGIILANSNYVKKVVFPLEILPVVTLGAALFHSLISLAVLLLALILFNGFIAWTFIFIPLVLIPLLLLLLGVSWILASIGVYMRDVGQAISALITIIMFLSPVFYPLSAVPERFQKFILLNPPTFIIEQMRTVSIWGHAPHWYGLVVYFIISFLTSWFGYFWFQKTRKGFADVL